MWTAKNFVKKEPTKGTPLMLSGKHAHIHVSENDDGNSSFLFFYVLVSPINWHM